jgi:hypothetical protein
VASFRYVNTLHILIRKGLMSKNTYIKQGRIPRSQQRPRRSSFHNAAELITAIEEYIQHHNRYPKTFIWTAKASDILEKVTRAHRVQDKLQSK